MNKYIFGAFLFVVHYSHGAEYTMLADFAAQGNVERVRELLEQYPDKVDHVEVVYPKPSIRFERDSALIAAARNNREGVLSLLLEFCASIDLVVGGTTALHVAVNQGHECVVDILLQRGARRDIENRSGLTPHALAVFCQHASIVALLEKEPSDRIEPA